MITIALDHLRFKPHDTILDMGCGEGRHTAALLHGHRGICIAADRDHTTLVTCREKLIFHEQLTGKQGPPWAVSAADITDLAFKTDTFDGVICSEVLEHIVDDERAVSELARVIKPGGNLAVSVPRFWPEKVCWLLSEEYFNANQGHVRIYTKTEIQKKIEATGFDLVKTHWAHSLHAPFWWLKCFVGPNRTDSLLVNLYHRFLVWDLMEKPLITRFLDRLLNPLLGKSLVFYFKETSKQ